MNQIYKAIPIDSPNLPLVCEPENQQELFGKFIPNKGAELKSDLGPFRSNDLYLPNFTLRTFEGRISRDAVFSDHHGSGNGMLGSCIFLKGKVKTFLPGGDRGIVSFNGSQNFKFDPNNDLRHYCPADTDLHFLHISMRPGIVNDFLPENETWAEKIKLKVANRQRIVGDRFAAITRTQQAALSNIFNTPLTGKLGYLMMEASVIQVILLQMYALFHQQTVTKLPPITKKDLDVIHDVKEYLHKTFLEDHTLTGLARQFGTNTNKLMNLFRSVFGQSIFDFISEQRMEYAKSMLEGGGVLVSEVSRAVGYKNPNHFSAAFKKRFGVVPSNVIHEMC